MKRALILLAAIGLFAACDKDNPEQGNVTYTLTQAKSAKRGVSFNFGTLPDQDVPLLQSAISWSYNWSSQVPSDAVDAQFTKYGLDWCPMLWNGNYNPDNIRAYKRKHPEAQYILAFNEPNLKDQANMTPAQAAELWPPVVALAKELGMKIVSPALNYGTLEDYHDPVKWMDEFLACDGVSLDDMSAIALHCYMPSAGGVKGFIDLFEKYGKPIWLTEFCNGNSNNISEDTQINYMCETLNMLEAHANVQRYAWFMPRGGFNSKWHDNLLTSEVPVELTTLGKVFVNFSTFDKSIYYGVDDVIPAEQYSSATGTVHLRPSSDKSGILEISELGKNGVVEYQLNIASAGTYKLVMRYLTYMDSSFAVSLNGTEVASKSLPSTSKEWTTGHFAIDLPAGRTTLAITGTSGASIALNWMKITK